MTIYTPYFYIIQDKRNGMYYAGSKYGKNSHPSLLLKKGRNGYLTTSNTIKSLIKIFGLDTFVIRKIKTFSTKEEAFNYERKFLLKVNARQNKQFYNGHNNDYNFFDNTGFAVLRDEKGNSFRIRCEDKLLHEGDVFGITKGKKPGILNGVTSSYDVTDPRWKTGEIVSVNKEKSNYFDPVTKSNFICSKQEAEEKGYFPFAKGFVSVRNKAGETFRVHKDDERLKSGEFFGATKGFITVKDKEGNFYSVRNDDPRLRSKELIPVNSCMTIAKDKEGNIFRVHKDDERLKSGELFGVSKGMSFYNNGVINKCFSKDSEIPEGFTLGRMKRR